MHWRESVPFVLKNAEPSPSNNTTTILQTNEKMPNATTVSSKAAAILWMNTQTDGGAPCCPSVCQAFRRTQPQDKIS